MYDTDNRSKRASDGEHQSVQTEQESQPGFQLPHWMWATMLASYAVFFIGIATATGRDGGAWFAIVVSIGYVVMFFGLATLLNSVKGHERPSPLNRMQGVLNTYCGPMNSKAVAAQILTVPLCFAFFAMALLLIRSIIMG